MVFYVVDDLTEPGSGDAEVDGGVKLLCGC